MVADSPTLTALLLELHDRREEALATATPADAPAITPAAGAALIVVSDRLLFRRIQQLTLAGHTNEEIETALLSSRPTSTRGLIKVAARSGRTRSRRRKLRWARSSRRHYGVAGGRARSAVAVIAGRWSVVCCGGCGPGGPRRDL
ncbi:hypothetical protein ACIPY6_44000 [Streptomyces sp. NPDC090054]|uniref:hypothetical protein n=1 Tax=Streptomyces sp. NPDC090054 TaxID=3365933 RepID=UPI0037F55C3D